MSFTGLSGFQEQRREISRMMLEFLVCTGRWVAYHVLSCGTRWKSRLEREDDGFSLKPVKSED